MLDLEKLLVDVFDPQPGEVATVAVDVPHGALADSDEWRSRREMAVRWRRTLEALGRKRGFTVRPILELAGDRCEQRRPPGEGQDGG